MIRRRQLRFISVQYMEIVRFSDRDVGQYPASRPLPASVSSHQIGAAIGFNKPRRKII